MSSCPGLHCPGCGDGGLPVALVLGGAGVIAAVVFVMENLAIIAAGLGLTGAVVLGSVLALRRFAVLDWNTVRRPALPRTVTAEAIPARHREAIARGSQHLHFHFDGMSPEDIAVIVGQAQARPAIREHA